MGKRRLGVSLRLSSALLAGLAMVIIAGCPAQNQPEHWYVSFDLSPDGKQVLFTAEDGDLYLFHLGTQSVRQLTKTNAIDKDPAFSPDGQSIVSASGRDVRKGWQVFVRSLDGDQVRQ